MAVSFPLCWSKVRSVKNPDRIGEEEEVESVAVNSECPDKNDSFKKTTTIKPSYIFVTAKRSNMLYNRDLDCRIVRLMSQSLINEFCLGLCFFFSRNLLFMNSWI